MFTLGNLICGFFAIVVASRIASPTEYLLPPTAAPFGHFDPADVTHNLMLSGWLIFLAMVFDALDGHVARLSRTSSDFGAQLDSLCDVVTFGVAPGFLLVKMCPEFAVNNREAIWIIAASFPACAALRLARFNAETDEDDDHMHFSGLPSPAAAAAIAGFAIFFYTLRKETNSMDTKSIDLAIQNVLPFFAAIVGALMVSRIPYPHVVNQALRGNRSLGHVVALLFGLVTIMVVRGFAIPLLATMFVIGPPIRYFWQRFYQRRAEEEPIF